MGAGGTVVLEGLVPPGRHGPARVPRDAGAAPVGTGGQGAEQRPGKPLHGVHGDRHRASDLSQAAGVHY